MPTPAEDDPKGERDCFERGAEKVGGGDGWADVWRKGCFGWEYKGFHHVSEQHLARYLAEFDFRYSHRSGIGVEDAERTDELLRNVAGKRLYQRPKAHA